MNIHPRPDQELAIQEAITAGLINSEIDALDIGLESLRKNLKARFSRSDSLVDVSPIKSNNLDSKRTPQEAAAQIRELRKNNSLPSGVAIRDLINAGRA